MSPWSALHAVFVLDHGWNSSVFCGSFNATNAAFHQNVEFMVELIGKRSRFGVDTFLEHIKGESKFIELLQEFRPAATSEGLDPVDGSSTRQFATRRLRSPPLRPS